MDLFRKIVKVAISLLAIVSVPSAYVFGLSILFPVSIRTLLDYQFFGSELVLLLLLLAGLGAVIRMQFVFVVAVHRRFIGKTLAFVESKSPTRRCVRRWLGWMILTSTTVGLFILIGLVASILFMFQFFLPWLALSAFIFIVGGFMVFGMDSDREFSLSNVSDSLSQFFKIGPAHLIDKPLIVSFLVGFSLFASFTLGAARIKSLASAKDVCVYLENDKVVGKLLGATGNGVIVKIGELDLRPYFDFSGRFNRFSDPQHQVVFFNIDSVRLVDPFCSQV
jgi:hypothetical protein